jgi:ABC-type oligopeptide transport system substrate-binding subunit
MFSYFRAKMAKLLAVFFLLLLLFALAFNVRTGAWYHPGTSPTDDRLCNKYGPMASSLSITPYENQEAEYDAFKAGDIDFMDCAINATQAAELSMLDPNMTTYARAFYVRFEMRQFDLNSMRFPCDNLQFRTALAHCFDKDAFIATQVGGLGLKLDSPLGWSTGWYNPYCTDLYQYNLTEAEAILEAAGFSDKDADGWREGPGGEEIFLEVYIRQDDPDRTAMGLQFCANLESIGVECNELVMSKSVCFQKVMVEFDYDVYTGDYSFGRYPDTLYFLYLGDYAQAFPYTPNYLGYSNPTFDLHAESMLTATEIGDPSTPSTAKYHIYEMQRILGDDVGVIPVYAPAYYGAYDANWEDVINEEGVGPWSSWTMFNAQREGADTINWGFSGDIDTLNAIRYVNKWSYSIWNGYILGAVYDTLIKLDPYDASQNIPWMAESWKFGNWTYNGEPAFYIEFKLREDMYWHDIPAKSDRVTPEGQPLLLDGAFDEKVMADDVVFSIYAFRDSPTAWNTPNSISNVVYAEEIDPYTVRVYWGFYIPQGALREIGQMPILPKHVWQPVFEEENIERILEFDPLGQECLSGCGPWVFDYTGSSIHEYYLLRANTRYFRYHPIDVRGQLDSYKILSPSTTANVSFYLHNQDFQQTTASNSFNITIEKIYPNETHVILFEGSNPELPPCEPVLIFEHSENVDRGLLQIQATITSDPLTGHADTDGYTIYIWCTILGDVNLDFYVNAKDAVALGAVFGSTFGDYNWNLTCDINSDGFINAKDAVLLGAVFGWPS